MSELADFLRARRERVSPAEVGIHDSGRRRTPGLRREELAALSGVSVDYLVRLEQGRDTNPSPSILGALADTLRLTDEEKRHLLMLAIREHNSQLCPSETTADRAVPPTVQALLDRFEPMPAFVTGPYGDLLAWTQGWGQLVRPLGLLDHERPNLARFLFAEPHAKAVYPEWDRAADEQVSRLRNASVRWHQDDGLKALMAELESIPDFASRWSTHEVGENRRGETALVHPQLGRIRVAYEVMVLADESEQRLVTWLPADDHTVSVFDEMAGAMTPTSPARLRVVGEA